MTSEIVFGFCALTYAHMFLRKFNTILLILFWEINSFEDSGFEM